MQRDRSQYLSQYIQDLRVDRHYLQLVSDLSSQAVLHELSVASQVGVSQAASYQDLPRTV